MKRRSFLAMVGLAPLASAGAAKVAESAAHIGNANIGKLTAGSVRVKFEVESGPVGYSGYNIRASGTGFRKASFHMDVPTDALRPTRLTLDADQLVIIDESGAVKSVFGGKGGA